MLPRVTIRPESGRKGVDIRMSLPSASPPRRTVREEREHWARSQRHVYLSCFILRWVTSGKALFFFIIIFNK